MTVIDTKRNPVADGALWALALACTLGLFGLACAAPRPKPDELSAAEHREEADSARAVADVHRQARKARAANAAADEHPAGLPVTEPREGDYTGWHLLEAARHALHARQHERAASALEHAEDTECRGVPVAARAACPILLFVSEVKDIEGGIRVRFRPEADVAQIVSLMRCHLSFARVRGFDRVPACPLYVRGVDIRRAGAGDAIDVVGSDPATTGELRTRIREMVAVER